MCRSGRPATTSQSEADEKRGRRERKLDEQRAKEERKEAKRERKLAREQAAAEIESGRYLGPLAGLPTAEAERYERLRLALRGLRIDGHLTAVVALYEGKKIFGARTIERFAPFVSLFELAFARFALGAAGAVDDARARGRAAGGVRADRGAAADGGRRCATRSDRNARSAARVPWSDRGCRRWTPRGPSRRTGTRSRRPRP